MNEWEVDLEGMTTWAVGTGGDCSGSEAENKKTQVELEVCNIECSPDGQSFATVIQHRQQHILLAWDFVALLRGR